MCYLRPMRDTATVLRPMAEQLEDTPLIRSWVRGLLDVRLACSYGMMVESLQRE